MSEGNGGPAYGNPADGTPPPPKSEHLNIKLKDDRENEVFFKVKSTTQLSKVITAYCNQQGVEPKTLRFFFDNQRINPGDTPGSLEMEDGDMIDVHQEQQGGSVTGSPSPEERPTHLTIKVKDQAEGEMVFRFKYTTPLRKMMTAYCKSKEVQYDSVRFLHDGERINVEDTAESRHLKDNDIIQAFLEQQGGDGSPQPEVAPEPEETKHIEIRVKDQNENEVTFKIKRQTPLRKVMDAYCQRAEKTRASVRFLFEGQRIQDNDTPLTLEMENEDVIEVFLEQLGGTQL